MVRGCGGGGEEGGGTTILRRPTAHQPASTARELACGEFAQVTPSDARAARALCGDDVRAERAPRTRGVHEGLRGMLGVHVAHFRPMCLTAWNSLRPPKSPTMSRTGPTRFDARSSRGG